MAEIVIIRKIKRVISSSKSDITAINSMKKRHYDSNHDRGL